MINEASHRITENDSKHYVDVIANVISIDNMRASDKKTIADGISGYELMGRAAQGIYTQLQLNGSVAIVVGPGNNGGDGYALACILAKNSKTCSVHRVSTKLSDDGAAYANEAAELGVLIRDFDAADLTFLSADVIVDCIYGTGFHGIPEKLVASAIKAINKKHENGAFVVCTDINSGLDGKHANYELAAKSDITVSIGQLKQCFFVNNTRKLFRELVNVEIGIEPAGLEDFLVDEESFDVLINEISIGHTLQMNEEELLSNSPTPYDFSKTDYNEGLDGLESSEAHMRSKNANSPLEAAKSLAKSTQANILIEGEFSQYIVLPNLNESVALKNTSTGEMIDRESLNFPIALFKNQSWVKLR